MNLKCASLPNAAVFAVRITSLLMLIALPIAGLANQDCLQAALPGTGQVTFNEALAVGRIGPYDPNALPQIPITIFRRAADRLLPEFFVGRRSVEILNQDEVYRDSPLPKPVHPMGIGLVGEMRLEPSRWSGAFRGGVFPIIARASLSQDNMSKTVPPSRIRRVLDLPARAQRRSTALAIKIFGNADPDALQTPTDIFFQNDLNGVVAPDGQAIDFTRESMTNMPTFSVLRIRRPYEVFTLLGVLQGAFSTERERISTGIRVNPGLRPPHGMAQLGESRMEDVHTPPLLKIVPSESVTTVAHDDMRLEVRDTLAANGHLSYDVSAADSVDQDGEIAWEKIGVIVFHEAILSEGFDMRLIFKHKDVTMQDQYGREALVPAPTGDDGKLP